MQATKMQIARARMMTQHAFFASLMFQHEWVEDESIPTARTNMVKVWYNPKFIESLDVNTAMFVIAHELGHIMFKHGTRREARDPETWNIAGDYAINIWLKNNGFTLWSKCYVKSEWASLTTEQIYDILIKKGGGSGGSGGLDADGIGRDIIPAPVANEAQRRMLEQAIDGNTAAAAMQARQQGQMTADMERIIAQLLKPQVPWNDILREFMVRFIPNEESWTRRNRRFRTVLPGRYSPAMGEIVIIGDTSGSMGDRELAMIATEIEQVKEQLNPERVRIIWADDHECLAEQVFERQEQVVLRPRGGGGTDMRKPLAYVERYEPIVTILCTDGCTPWPDEATPYPLIVLTTDQEGPAWATSVKVDV